jgi:hypothetical protein
LAETIVRFDEWLKLVLSAGVDVALAAVPDSNGCVRGADLALAISRHLTQHAWGLDRDLLCKSLQESLLLVGGAPACSRERLEDRLLRSLRRSGNLWLIRRTLSCHFFNVVWFRTSDAFRSTAGNEDLFERDMIHLEQSCRRTVESVWKSRQPEASLELPAVANLVGVIELRLRGIDSRNLSAQRPQYPRAVRSSL